MWPNNKTARHSAAEREGVSQSSMRARREMEQIPIFHRAKSQNFNLDSSQCYQINVFGADRLPVLLLTRLHYKVTTAHFPSPRLTWYASSATLPSAILAPLPSLPCSQAYLLSDLLCECTESFQSSPWQLVLWVWLKTNLLRSDLNVKHTFSNLKRKFV